MQLARHRHRVERARALPRRRRGAPERRAHAGRRAAALPEAVLGVLVLASPQPDACSATDLALIERVAAVAAVAIENARLLSRIKERTRALESLSSRQEALLETIAAMSSPVVPIARGALVMPIVGALDTHRSGRFIEAMLREISEHQARVVIIDVTGMAVVDASAAGTTSLRRRAPPGCSGPRWCSSRIAPQTARLMVEQGLDLGGIVTPLHAGLGFSYALGRGGRAGRLTGAAEPRRRPRPSRRGAPRDHHRPRWSATAAAVTSAAIAGTSTSLGRADMERSWPAWLRR